MTNDQIAGPLRAMMPFICAMLVAYKVVPQEIADQIPSAVIGAISAVGALAAILMSAWSWFANSRASMAKKVAGPDVHVVVGPTAPDDMKALAADPTVPGVTSGYTAGR